MSNNNNNNDSNLFAAGAGYQPVRPTRRTERGGRGCGGRRGHCGRRLQRETALLVHSAHRHGHHVHTQPADDAQRDIQLYYGQVPVLPAQQTGLAELDQTQPEPERLFHQDPEGADRHGRQHGRRQGQLLDAGPGGRGRHVRARQLQAEADAPAQAIPAAKPPPDGKPRRSLQTITT